ncbi:hypothetical protein ACFQE1_17655 [Halobium palmae]|uniref:Uncharacterized protein n=1 Tax=Halobium palmae TaxID=1776492 RepID=A0ABD5S3B0_9EURY
MSDMTDTFDDDLNEAWYSTPEGAMNLILLGVVGAALLFGLIFAAMYLGYLPTLG